MACLSGFCNVHSSAFELISQGFDHCAAFELQIALLLLSPAAVGYSGFASSPKMTLRSIVRDLRESFGNLSRRNFEAKISSVPSLSGHHREKSLETASELQDSLVAGSWANLPPELLRDVMKRLEEDDSNWPSRKDVVACASVCTTWREMCKDIVRNPEFCGKLTFPVSLKQVTTPFYPINKKTWHPCCLSVRPCI